jgi:hypothetical protein
MSTTLTQASHQWATRPDDERFTNLDDLLAHFKRIRNESRGVVVSSRRITAQPESDNKGLLISGPNGHPYAPTHHAFGQLATLAEAPAGYLRTMPAPIVADCLNYGFRFQRSVEDIGVLLQKNGSHVLRCATGPYYGRVWNSDITQTLVNRFGNGRDGDWKIPGEFGKQVEITKANTTLFASDRDMFVFLADEQNRVELPGRRAGMMGTFARGFFVWNSEVGDKTLGIASFLFDYTCCNRIVWGVEGFKKITIRHSAGAPDRWLEEMQPVLLAYSHGSAKPVEDALRAAQAKKIDDVEDFLATRFAKRMVQPMLAIHQLEEHRPVETVWDAVTAATAYAKSTAHQDARVEIERKAGALLDLVAA